MGYVTTARPAPVRTDQLGFSWPSWAPWGKSDEEKAAETMANINAAIQEFRQAHETAVALYRAGLLTEKLSQEHVDVRDKINNLLIKIFDAVSPEEYLEIHNYLARVREDVGLGLAPLIIIGGLAVIAVMGASAAATYKEATALNKKMQNEAEKIGLIERGLAPPSILEVEKEASKGLFEKLFGIDPMMIGAAVLAIALAPTAFKYVKRKL